MIQPAPLQLRHDILHEIRIATWDVRRGDHEPVARPLGKERFEHVGDLARSTHDGVVRATAVAEVHQLAHGGVAFATHGDDPVTDALQAREARQFIRGQLLVQALGREIEVEALGQQR